MKSLVACSATFSGSVTRLGASVRNRPGCGKSITSGGLPPWSNTGAWTSNWSVPWKSIVTPVHSASGAQKSVKRWMASGSFSLLRTGERTLTVLPSCCWSHGISLPSMLSSPPAAPTGVGARRRSRRRAPVSAVRLGPGGRRRGVGGTAVVVVEPQATRTRDAMAPSATTRLPYLMLKLPLQEHGSEQLRPTRSAGPPPSVRLRLLVEMHVESNGRFRAKP